MKSILMTIINLVIKIFNIMQSKSYLANTIVNIQKNFNKNNLEQPSEARSRYLSLSEPQKYQYIKSYEKRWHQFVIISNILSDLLYAVKKLEGVKQIGHKKDQPKIFKQIKEYEEELNYRHQKVNFLTKSIYNNISMLLLFINDNLNIDCKNYTELNYIRLLRNCFLQHPNYSFQPNNTIKVPNNSSKEISTSDVKPKYGGWVFIFEYYLNNINDNYLKKSDSANKKQNKTDFISVADSKRDWKNLITNNKELFFRIKAYGLPDFDQKETALYLKKLFSDHVYGYFK